MMTDRVCFSLTNDSKSIVSMGSGNLQHAPETLMFRDLCFSISKNACRTIVRIYIYIYVFATIFARVHFRNALFVRIINDNLSRRPSQNESLNRN